MCAVFQNAVGRTLMPFGFVYVTVNARLHFVSPVPRFGSDKFPYLALMMSCFNVHALNLIMFL